LTFWTRRFFRIAPLYYVLLLVAIILGPELGAARDAIAVAIPGTGTVDARYTDQSWQNLVLHLSFIFGFSPSYGFRTALPDWSIGLEMAFYAAFPFLMISAARIGFVTTALGATLLCYLLSLIFSGYFTAFAEPSMLALKLPVFLGGMLIAVSLKAEGRHRLILLGIGAAICLMPIRGAESYGLAPLIRLLSLGSLAVLADCHRLPPIAGLHRIAPKISALFGSRPATFLGDTSYGVYLLHLLVMLPVMQVILLFHPTSRPALFLATVAIVLPAVYGMAWCLHLWIERPGIRWGRHLLKTGRTKLSDKSELA
jgi:peptidoglycan/LPS O-acetylase OafA/YrhL